MDTNKANTDKANTDRRQTLSLVIPCYNEAPAIPKMIARLGVFLETVNSNLDSTFTEIHIVDDGSTDNSYELLQANSNSHIFIHRLEANKGYGYAIKYGISQSCGDYIAILDLDDTYPPEEILNLWNILRQKHLPMVIGNRFSQNSQMPQIRRLGNKLYANFIYLWLRKKVDDPCSGMRIFTREAVKSFINQLPNDLSFALALTTIFHTQKLEFIEIPINYGRRVGTSKLKEINDGFLFFRTIIRYGRPNIKSLSQPNNEVQTRIP